MDVPRLLHIPSHGRTTEHWWWTLNGCNVLAMLTTGISSSNLLREPHTAIICGQTGYGKKQFVLDELLHPDHGYYRDAFEVIFILCPSWKRNRTYLERPWLWRGSSFLFIDPGERLHDCLRALFSVAADTPTLYLIDDMAASKALTLF